MAAYAAIVSLMNTINQIEHHPSPPISIHKQQLESLTQILTFLQEFLESYKSPVADGDEADPLEMRIADAAHAVEDVIESHIVDKLQPRRSKRIADAAYAAEDAIESHIVDKLQLRRSKKAKIDTAEADEQINFYQDRLQQVIEEMNVIKKEAMENELGRSMSPNEEFFEGCDTSSDYSDEVDAVGKEVSCIDFYEDLQRVIEEMNVIKKEAMETSADAQLQRKVSSTHAGSLTSSSTVKKSMMVGFDDVVLQLLDKLTGGNRNRQIIPITGMDGIGKTTLARHIFEHALVKEHFDIRAWTTISQTYNVRETLR
ncbi:putative late blight resistance protein homolog R1B-12 isoform X2 [Salvia miltiorrhiza]|uniref:putative late blight resistance protein homolog R1B-12 isoform X2 n=1 Tax=Salvia miltiorrhiza TaxID=226208 RepID=UPI0025AD89DC|nr:putative late blight resistance protein homolog R1B-12 isoform X2 [Salvia miltiorrhiza]